MRPPTSTNPAPGLQAHPGGLRAQTASSSTSLPITGPMVQPFPEPGQTVRTAMEQLQQASIDPPEDEEALRELAAMPRPWDPGSCKGALRRELWMWLDQVAAWVNQQHLWNLTRPGIPECWPAHPHLVHDLAVLACSRYYTTFAVTPAALEDWQRHQLPGFLDRIRDRLAEGCQPARHQPRPRQDRDRSLVAPPAREARSARYADDLTQAATTPPAHPRPREPHGTDEIG